MTSDSAQGRPIRIADGVFWVGGRSDDESVACNPFLIVQDDRAVLIDSGSRSDFAVVMMRILQAGIDPRQIVALIYQHYDPDLCGSMANFIDMCDNPELQVVSEKDNNVFISYYIPREKKNLLRPVEAYGHRFTFAGRELVFVPTPYSHSPGSFVTYDVQTQTLFSSDLFGSFEPSQGLFWTLADTCYDCADFDRCPGGRPFCPLKSIAQFHQKVMPCQKALRYAMAQVKDLDIQCIAPQHGGIFHRRRDIVHLIERLAQLTDVGIDGVPGAEGPAMPESPGGR